MISTENQWNNKKQQFIKLWPSENPAQIENIWDILTTHYSESSRFYHTKQHILDCLQHYEDIKKYLTSSDAVQMSIWFHDIIYDIKATDNEEKSAAFFAQIAKNILSREFIDTVKELIISTKHKKPPPNCDQAFLVDIDLSSFGSTWEKFIQDGEKLRKEAPHLTEKQFNDNKISFFQMLLSRKKIFFTDYFHDRYELVAHKNIALQTQKILNADKTLN